MSCYPARAASAARLFTKHAAASAARLFTKHAAASAARFFTKQDAASAARLVAKYDAASIAASSGASSRTGLGRRLLLTASLALVLSACGSSTASPQLPKLNIDPDRLAVAGLSSGAYMATQAHIAFSDHLIGAGMLAGGPYGCAEGDLNRALSVCMKAKPSAPDVEVLADKVRERAAAGRIASIDGLKGDHVWVWHGTEDALVADAVSRSSAELYQALGGAIVVWDGELKAGHGFPVTTGDGNCASPTAPFLANCGFDAAATLMSKLFGNESASSETVAEGELRRFDQTTFVNADAASPQLADEGFVYVPAACDAGERCGLLVVFHGCEQNADAVGDAFVRGSGLNALADRYATVLLYPQVKASFMPLNPKACWDWWGYTGADYDTRDGAQLQWLNAATSALGASLR